MGLTGGPPPQQNRRRRNATVAMVSLPGGGREGKAPRWPLGPDLHTAAEYEVAQDDLAVARADGATAARIKRLAEKVARLRKLTEVQERREKALWVELWSTPQAAQWEKLRWTRDVAMYVRDKVLAEAGDRDAAKEARQWSDRLGLNPLSMLRLRWEITDLAPELRAVAGEAGVAKLDSARSRRERLSE